jgi:hypothetical protein
MCGASYNAVWGKTCLLINEFGGPVPHFVALWICGNTLRGIKLLILIAFLP